MTITPIPLEGASNARDLSGYPAADRRVIAPHRLLRSGELSALTPRDIQTLTTHFNLRQIIDFRCDVEIAEKPNIPVPGTSYAAIPVLQSTALGLTREGGEEKMMRSIVEQMMASGAPREGYLIGLYRQMIADKDAQAAYRQFFTRLLAQPSGATLWHCSAGKDRAGLAAILVELALGVPDDVIEADYLATNTCNPKMTRAVMANVAHHPAAVQDAILAVLTVCPEYFSAIFDAMIDQSGSPRDYLRDVIGLTDSETRALRALYLQ